MANTSSSKSPATSPAGSHSGGSCAAAVHFVGAGPGAADLITLRGQRLLGQADVLIWAGSLVNPEILDSCRPGCEIYDSAQMTLEDVVLVMERAVSAGKSVVRLHTGDPSIYGAIREQMDALDSRGISYDVTPGVSSFSGAAAALCAEWTLPGVSQSLVITRAEGRTPVPAQEQLQDLAAHGNSTLILFLSSGLAAKVQRDLLAAGRPATSPVAVVYKASWPDERIVRCTLATLPQAMEEAGINRMALIIVGAVLDALPQDADGSRAACQYQRSCLYDPAFETGYRPAPSPARAEVPETPDAVGAAAPSSSPASSRPQDRTC